MSDDRDTRIELERSKTVFAKGLGGLTILVKRNESEISRIDEDVDRVERQVTRITEQTMIHSGIISRIEDRVPADLRAILVRIEQRVEHLENAKKENTQKVRTLELNEAKGLRYDKTQAAKIAMWGSIAVAVISSVIAMITAFIG